ncbi:hypothetical protein [Sphingomonas sp. BAUL-RG-20F-R05-02]|nr:hypothetical protein [Sphingomonas sp. BAUL-RG-20F-R05-02]
MGLLTQKDLDALGSKLSRVYHLQPDDDQFADLLAQLDAIEATPPKGK